MGGRKDVDSSQEGCHTLEDRNNNQGSDRNPTCLDQRRRVNVQAHGRASGRVDAGVRVQGGERREVQLLGRHDDGQVGNSLRPRRYVLADTD